MAILIHRSGPVPAWQWLFLIEGIPPILLALVVLFWLVDEPEHCDAGPRW